MTMLRTLRLLALLAVVTWVEAGPRNTGVSPSANLPSTSALPKVQYDWRYAVNDAASGVVSQRWEQRLGEYVKGAYSLVEPDGSVRHVDYEVDGAKGFHAVVRTSPPVNSLLSLQELNKVRARKQPPVNVLTNHPEAAASAQVSATVSAAGGPEGHGSTPRASRLLPINFHSVRPDYYLAFARGEPARYRESTPQLELPFETPAELEEEAAARPPAPPQPAPGRRHHHHHPPSAAAAVLPILRPVPATLLAVPRGRSVASPPHFDPVPLPYATHTDAIFKPFPPLPLAADLYAE